MDYIENITHTYNETMNKTERSIEILVYAIIIGIFVCLAMWLYRICKCIKYCGTCLCNCCCTDSNPSYEEL